MNVKTHQGKLPFKEQRKKRKNDHWMMKNWINPASLPNDGVPEEAKVESGLFISQVIVVEKDPRSDMQNGDYFNGKLRGFPEKMVFESVFEESVHMTQLQVVFTEPVKAKDTTEIVYKTIRLQFAGLKEPTNDLVLVPEQKVGKEPEVVEIPLAVPNQAVLLTIPIAKREAGKHFLKYRVGLKVGFNQTKVFNNIEFDISHEVEKEKTQRNLMVELHGEKNVKIAESIKETFGELVTIEEVLGMLQKHKDWSINEVATKILEGKKE